MWNLDEEQRLRARLANIVIVGGVYQIKLFNPIVTVKKDWKSKIINFFGGSRGSTRVLAQVAGAHSPQSYESFITAPSLPTEAIYKAISDLSLEGVVAESTRGPGNPCIESIKDPRNPRIVFTIDTMDADVSFHRLIKAASEILKRIC